MNIDNKTDKSENPKVSIIIPAYNVEKYIGECLDSLINQTLEDIEIIVINDNSSDRTLSIISDYLTKDSRIKLIDNKFNKGVSAARNEGLAIAKGEYIGFVDSDDWVATDFYERLYYAAKRFDSEIAVTNFVRCDKFRKSKRLNYKKEELFINPSDKIRESFIPKFNYIWNKIYKRDAMINLGVKFPEGKIFEDVIWLVQVVYALKGLVTVPDTYYFYRRNSGSIVTRRSSSATSDNIAAYKELYNFMKNHDIPLFYPCKTGKKEKIKLFGITVLQKEYYYPNKEIYKLLGLIKLFTIDKNYTN